METCRVDECSRTIHVMKEGLCRAHYQQFRKGRDLTPTKQIDEVPCLVPNCNKQQTTRGLCSAHGSIGNRFKIETDYLLELMRDAWCYCCEAPIENMKMHIDHDHGCCPTNNTCGECTRGTLCAQCNHYLGVVRDKPATGSKYDLYLKGAPHLSPPPWERRYRKTRVP